MIEWDMTYGVPSTAPYPLSVLNKWQQESVLAAPTISYLLD